MSTELNLNNENSLSLWTIYFSPKDFPGKYVVRKHVIGCRELSGMRWISKEPDYIGDSLREARMAIPKSKVCLGRDDADDSVIVENWV